MSQDLRADVEAVLRLPAVETILEVVCRTTGMGFAAVARVTEDRWVACQVRDEIAFGLKPHGELKVETTICNEIRRSGQEVVIDHVGRDEAYRGHPTPAMYGFQSYISVPIVLPGKGFFGTLCAIDPRPATLRTPQVVGMFRLFAELIASHLEAQDRLDTANLTLVDERRTSELREQFIAVLGHDLRNPLASIDAGAHLLGKLPLSKDASAILAMMQSSAKRMTTMIDNVLDFARGRMGGGLTLDRSKHALAPVLTQVAAELVSVRPDPPIETAFDLAAPVLCDPGRVGQLASNLLANALIHGDGSQPVRLLATSGPTGFELAVTNGGPPIPPAALEHLFRPFERGAVVPGQRGLGLGLYIASEIARAHGGTLTVKSTVAETRFTFRMPA
ncbi:MAG: HAMP domain-containing histidine kinase [Reyranella sp.]|uniref:GAF domain-containing sensor histidine kinase n=1 Tax=Reyranella sp. TaxID=1929291 RepID=UPI001AC0B336|nr:HAMP domain-containing sensor histidine kinase [Reyranella sp.]MBN9085484.1 HAMP domain-containing histidine kinase [Reyranella sp.]